jgi:hypothetical protein
LIRDLSKLMGLNAGLMLAAGAVALAIATPASAHEERYYYEAKVNNIKEPTYPGGDGDFASGDTSVGVSVQGVRAYANEINGGTVYAGASLPGMDPFSTLNLEYANGYGYLSYNLWIDGPDPDALVPVRMMGAGSVWANNSQATGEAWLRFGEVGLGLPFTQWSAIGQGNNDTGVFQPVAAFEVDQVFFMKPSSTYYIEMYAGAGVQAVVFNGATARASVDPTFTIQGDFALNYRVMGVPGGAVVNPPGGGVVPEPATWAMMVAGFGLLGGTLRRRKFAASLAA